MLTLHRHANQHKHFVDKVRQNLTSLNFFTGVSSKGAVGVGVSGGADSVSLFMTLLEILQKEQESCRNFSLVVVTVNHHIRKAEETDGDVNFVKELVERYKKIYTQIDIRLEVFDLEEGLVQNEASKRKCGIEEAARYLRYECFSKAIEKYNIDFFCLAHNRNDNLETILMRFLQGNFSGSGSGGIPFSREKYIRPLLNISRNEIEEFLNSQNQTWRNDSTNNDENYLRNNIRKNLVPLLDEKFPFWENALLTGSEKAKIDSDYISSVTEKYISFSKRENKVTISLEAFEHDATAFRVIIKAMNLLGVNERIPHEFLKDAVFEIRNASFQKKSFSKRFSSCEVCYEKNNVFVKTYMKKQTDFGFFDIIKEEGIYEFPFGKLSVLKSEKEGYLELTANGKSVTYKIDFPFVIRSNCLGEKKQPFVVEG